MVQENDYETFAEGRAPEAIRAEAERQSKMLKLVLVGMERVVPIWDPTSIIATRRGLLICREGVEPMREFYNWRIVNSFTMGSALWPRFLED